MAADVTIADAGRQAAPVKTPHRKRFVVIYGVLGAVLAAAIAGTVIFAGRSINPPAAWSSWHPKGGGLGAATEVATHVSAEYRLPNGNQLVEVITKAPAFSPPQGGTIPIHFIAVKAKSGHDQIYSVDSKNSVMYTLCGVGAACTIGSGTATPERGQVVRREILELALYTFKYVHGIDNVLAFLPPKSATAPKYVVYIRRSDLADVLKKPLAKTLAVKAPPSTGLTGREASVVDAATGKKIYTYGLTQAPQGDLVFLLSPFVG